MSTLTLNKRAYVIVHSEHGFLSTTMVPTDIIGRYSQDLCEAYLFNNRFGAEVYIANNFDPQLADAKLSVQEVVILA